MHVAAIVFFCLLAWARPSHQHPSRLQRTTGCRCSTIHSNQTHAFWLQPPELENPSDTCRRLGYQLGHWLAWIDGNTDLQTAWQLYDDILQNRQANTALQQKKGLNRTASQDEEAAEKSTVSCSIEGMDDSREGATPSDFLLIRVFLGIIVLVVLFESVSTICGRLGRGLSKFFSTRSSAGEIRL